MRVHGYTVITTYHDDTDIGGRILQLLVLLVTNANVRSSTLYCTATTIMCGAFIICSIGYMYILERRRYTPVWRVVAQQEQNY